MPLLLAVIASVFFAGSYVLQYHEAHRAPARLFLSPRLLLELARHPVWLAGIAAMIVGNLLQAAALGSGSLAVIEPVLTASLLFALPLSAAWRREHLSRMDWVGAAMVAAGIALLLVLGAPGAGSTDTDSLGWSFTTLSCWGLAAVMVAIGERRAGQTRAALVAAAAGVLFGLQDALTRSAIALAQHSGVGGLLASWQPWVIIVTALYGLTLAQSSYEAGTLTAALPAMTVGEPVTGILIGVLALDEPMRTGGGLLAGEVIGGLIMLYGTYLLARSPLVLGRAHPRHRIREPVG